MTKKLVDSYDKLHNGHDGHGGGVDGRSSSESASSEWIRSVNQTSFSHLSLDIPACPLFRDSEGGLVIPQVCSITIVILAIIIIIITILLFSGATIRSAPEIRRLHVDRSSH